MQGVGECVLRSVGESKEVDEWSSKKGWLYVISFCLFAALLLGQLVPSMQTFSSKACQVSSSTCFQHGFTLALCSVYSVFHYCLSLCVQVLPSLETESKEF